MNPEPAQSESELIRRFKNNDEEAFRALFRSCEGALQARVEKMLPKALKRRISIADLLQETMIVAFQQKHKFVDRGPDSFRKWLVGIMEKKAYHTLQRHANAAKRNIAMEVSRKFRASTAAYAGEATSPSQAAMSSELESLALEVMAELPDDYREVLQLAYVEHLGIDEIAARLERSREAARKLYGRALLAFTDRFNRSKGGDDA